MKVPILNSYNPYLRETSSNGIADAPQIRRTKQTQLETKNTESEKLNSPNSNSYNNVITKSERKFFMKLFPESSEQLEKHQIFNRSGRVDSPALSKGRIIDGRI